MLVPLAEGCSGVPEVGSEQRGCSQQGGGAGERGKLGTGRNLLGLLSLSLILSVTHTPSDKGPEDVKSDLIRGCSLCCGSACPLLPTQHSSRCQAHAKHSPRLP